jgi:exosortase
MSGPDVQTVPNPDGVIPVRPAIEWLPLGWFTILLVGCYYPVLQALVSTWVQNEDMGHGFFVPAIAAYIAWQRRDEVLAAPSRRNWWGLAILALAALQLVLGTLAAELFLTRSAFVESLIGAVLLVCGWARLRLVAFPLFLMFFMIPLPAIVYNQITFPLQLIASRVAEASLNLLDIPVLREGNILELASQKLSVVEACSGIRSLLSLTFLSLVYSYFFDTKTWMRWFLLVATVPIAIVANSCRVTITGVLSEWKPEYAHGVYHSVSGWVIFMVALAILVFVHSFANLVWRGFHGRK